MLYRSFLEPLSINWRKASTAPSDAPMTSLHPGRSPDGEGDNILCFNIPGTIDGPEQQTVAARFADGDGQTFLLVAIVQSIERPRDVSHVVGGAQIDDRGAAVRRDGVRDRRRGNRVASEHVVVDGRADREA